MAHGDNKISKILYSKSGGGTDTLEIHDAEALHSIENGSIETDMIAGKAVTTEKIADNSVTSDKIQNGTIAADDLNSALLKRITDLEAAWDSISQIPNVTFGENVTRLSINYQTGVGSETGTALGNAIQVTGYNVDGTRYALYIGDNGIQLRKNGNIVKSWLK